MKVLLSTMGSSGKKLSDAVAGLPPKLSALADPAGIDMDKTHARMTIGRR